MKKITLLLIALCAFTAHSQQINYLENVTPDQALAKAEKEDKLLCIHNLSSGCGGGDAFMIDVLSEPKMITYMNEKFVNVYVNNMEPGFEAYFERFLLAGSATLAFFDEQGNTFHQFNVWTRNGMLNVEQVIQKCDQMLTGETVLAGELEAKIRAWDTSYETLSQYVDYVDGNGSMFQERLKGYMVNAPIEHRFTREFYDLTRWDMDPDSEANYFVVANQDSLRSLFGDSVVNPRLWWIREEVANKMLYAGKLDTVRLKDIYAKNFAKFFAGLELRNMEKQYWKDVNNKDFWPLFRDSFIAGYKDSIVDFGMATRITWQSYWTAKILNDQQALADLLVISNDMNRRLSGDAYNLNTLAHLQYDNGMKKEAIATQEQCVLATEGSYLDPGFIGFMKDELELFKKGKPVVPKL